MTVTPPLSRADTGTTRSNAAGDEIRLLGVDVERVSG